MDSESRLSYAKRGGELRKKGGGDTQKRLNAFNAFNAYPSDGTGRGEKRENYRMLDKTYIKIKNYRDLHKLQRLVKYHTRCGVHGSNMAKGVLNAFNAFNA